MGAAPLVQVIVNPVSGRGGREAVLAGLIGRLRWAGYEVRVGITKGPGDAAAMAAAACAGSCRALVVVGGDGTINEVIRRFGSRSVPTPQGVADGPPEGRAALASAESQAGDRHSATTCVVGSDREAGPPDNLNLSSGPPILLVPTGTENLLARYLRIRLDAEWLFRTFQADRRLDLDVPTMNGQPFLMIAGIGFDAAVVRRVTRARAGHITRADYFWPTWRTFWSYRHPRLRVEVDGERFFEGRGMVFVGNIPRYALGLRILDRANPSDGLVDVCAFPCTWQGPLLGHAALVLFRWHVTSPTAYYRQGRKVRLTSNEPVDIELDGEQSGMLPAEIEVTSQRAAFLIGPGPAVPGRV